MSSNKVFEVIVALVRHEPHKDNVVAEADLAHAHRVGELFEAKLCDEELEPGHVRFQSPQPRAIQTGDAFCAGAEYEFEGEDLVTHDAFGDVTNGAFALTPEEIALFKAYMTEYKCGAEHALINCDALRDKITSRGQEAAEALKALLLEYANETTNSFIGFGHGARWEPMISVLLGKPINQAEFLMDTGTVALLKLDVDTKAGTVTLKNVEYLGDLGAAEALKAEAEAKPEVAPTP